jgi:hypothetical protein
MARSQSSNVATSTLKITPGKGVLGYGSVNRWDASTTAPWKNYNDRSLAQQFR